MADEQIIYLSPEEDLTSVRERLEKVQSKRMILVIPTQTQLRSHVSWRLLHSRARELGKDVLIVSSDRQIRSVVKAAGFRVADSLESPPSGKPRRGSRPGRAALGGKTSPRLRTPSSKVAADQQASGTMSTSSGLRGGGARAAKEGRGPDQQYAPTTQQDVEERQRSKTQRDEIATGGMKSPHTFEIEDVTSSPGFEPDLDYHSSPAPLRPVNPPFEEEEPGNLHLFEDFQQAQNIRQSAQAKQAQGKAEDTMLTPPTKHTGTSPSTPGNEPFRYMEDIQTSPLPEQRASVPIEELDEGIPDITDISEYPTADIIQIEDEGDLGAVDLPDISPHTWTDATPDEEQDMLDRPGPARIHGVRPRSNRTGKIVSPPPPPSQPNVEDETELPPPPIANQPPRTMPSPLSSSARQSGALRFSAGNRPPEAIPLGQARTASKPLQPPAKQRPQKSQPIARATKPPAPTAPRPQQRRRDLAGPIALAVIILFVLLLFLLAYFGPSADVTVTLPSHDLHSQMTLTATSSSRLDVLHQTLPAQTLTFDTSATGQGHATGSTTVGTKPATGTVVFTNKGTGQVIIPTGTTVSTKSGAQFVTQGEVLANNIPTPIQAVTAGVTGNVAANTITVIPPDSLVKIQQANPGATINLSVTNADPTSGGGVGTAKAVAQGDVNKTKTGLDAQLQTQINDFLKKHVHAGKAGDQSDPGDQVGHPVRQETVTSTPLVGNVSSNGNFTETIKLHMTVLVVRVADLQTAAQAQLKETLSKGKSGLALAPQQRVTFTQMKNTSPSDGGAVVLSFTATGQVAPQVSEDTVRNLVSGKSVDDAKHALTGSGGIPNVVGTPQITVSPSFFPRLPFWGPRITVHFKTVPTKATPAPTKKPKKK